MLNEENDFKYNKKPDDMQTNIMQLFESKKYVKVCAPMVRYSKLQFRQLLRHYDCDLTFTPMMLADSFVLSQKARDNEFSTSVEDTPLISQFASNNINDFVGAALLISPFCDGIDLNCGCPQRWAKKLGLGCALMDSPELMCEMIKECKQTVSKNNFTVSVKTRILNDLNKTVDLCRKLDRAGADFITIHARTSDQHTGDINIDALKLIIENVSCPVIANGGVESLQDCDKLHEDTKCKGVMSANGLLSNPTLFSGRLYDLQAAKVATETWIMLCFNEEMFAIYAENDKLNILDLKVRPGNVTFQCFHHHLVFMLGKILWKRQKRIFNNLKTFEDVLNFICEENLIPDPPYVRLDSVLESYRKHNLHLTYETNNEFIIKHKTNYERDNSNGKFYTSFTNDYSLGTIFE